MGNFNCRECNILQNEKELNLLDDNNKGAQILINNLSTMDSDNFKTLKAGQTQFTANNSLKPALR
jgi:hypothetical protein